MLNPENEMIFEKIAEQLELTVTADDRLLFARTFSLLSVRDNAFVFSYSDKSAYRAFIGRNKNALMVAAGTVCGKLPDISFKYIGKTAADKPAGEPQTAVPKNKNKSLRKGIRNIIASLVCLILAFAVAIVSVNFIANLSFKENFYSLSLENTYDNFRVIQLSDLHNSKYGGKNSKLLHRIEKLEPDIIVMTGDCLDVSGDIDEITALCSSLAKIAPTYYIYGNNEWKRAFGCETSLEAIDKLTGSDGESRDAEKLYSADNGLRETLGKTGVKVLFNESDTVNIGSNRVKIFGTLTSNPSAFWDYAGKSFYDYLSSDNDCVKITLCHEPVLLETLKEESWGSLVLCGDTHGGVVRLPVFGAAYSKDYGILPERSSHMIYGKFKSGNSDVIVSSGLTNRGFPRIFNQPELVIIDINKY